MKYLMILFLSSAAFAQTKPAPKPKPAEKANEKTNLGQPITQFADWAVFSGITPQGKICYIASQPKERLPKHLKPDPAFMMISMRPAEKIMNELSMKTGYPTKSDVDGTLTIGAVSFPLFMKGEGGWVKLPADEPKLLAALKTGTTMSFKATSQKGNLLTDNYSLAGLSQALEKATAECK